MTIGITSSERTLLAFIRVFAAKPGQQDGPSIGQMKVGLGYKWHGAVLNLLTGLEEHHLIVRHGTRRPARWRPALQQKEDAA
jgi:hypothetical protein